MKHILGHFYGHVLFIESELDVPKSFWGERYQQFLEAERQSAVENYKNKQSWIKKIIWKI